MDLSVAGLLRQGMRPIYNAVLRDRLPHKYGVYAGVAARDIPLLDLDDRRPDYKRGLITALHKIINQGDDVVLIGAGRGVSSVHACQAGADSVVGYEAAVEMCSVAGETVGIAGVGNRVDIRNALVGDKIEVYGNASEARVVDPATLTTGDVLVSDCEGAEASILMQLENWPRSIIVETHPERGIPNDQSRKYLASAGYDIVERPYHPDCNHEDKCVLVGTRDDRADSDDQTERR